ncbi:hypothetical protein PV10_07830 [Exophiala mesophila]|uniref:C2H2-type domain-containing protein n=1 Tax=Exophiala mesophila TaxID=212818 RepID=A0A0D1Z6V2_EXOME|nr:uncharacterized protein PV10_07830 [Exophiala mesophila]KIV90537.1 hypothetical protein PV10_07830 [Exophiala mesophila]
MLHVSRARSASSIRWPKIPVIHACGPWSTTTHQPRRSLLTLAIETSCDDTCVAILSKPSRQKPHATLHFNEKITAENTGKGGIVPVEALSSHHRNLASLLDRSLSNLPDAPDGNLRVMSKASLRTIRLRDGRLKRRPDFVSVTRGPGMAGNLSVGLNTAKGLATAWQIPFIGVHHMQAHALTSRMVDALSAKGSDNGAASEKSVSTVSPSFPFLTLLVSGGHTLLLHSHTLTEHKILSTTTDVAVGDELDKCGRLILPEHIKSATQDTSYAKYLSSYAFPTRESFEAWSIPRTRAEELEKPANAFGWTIPTPMVRTRDLAFSFSGISSTVKRIQASRDAKAAMSDDERIHLARSCLSSAFEHLGSRTIIALEKLTSDASAAMTPMPTPTNLVVSGGVASSLFLRYHLRRMLDLRGFRHINLIFPPVEFCTDNAAMIAWAGMEMFEAGYTATPDCQPLRQWSLDAAAADGGILGPGGWHRQEHATMSRDGS